VRLGTRLQVDRLDIYDLRQPSCDPLGRGLARRRRRPALAPSSKSASAAAGFHVRQTRSHQRDDIAMPRLPDLRRIEKALDNDHRVVPGMPRPEGTVPDSQWIWSFCSACRCARFLRTLLQELHGALTT
jgi:hypothetical protein